MEWISVEDRLPEPGDYVLVYACGLDIDICHRKDNRWISTDGYKYVEPHPYSGTSITHWMPLPKPPKEGNDGN